MAKMSRKGDVNQTGGAIVRGAVSVFVNGIPAGLHVSTITPHAPWGKPHPPHDSPTTTDGSPSVIVESCPALRVGSGNTCGHSIVQGSENVFVP